MNITLLLLTHNSSEDITNNFKWLDKCKIINEIIAIDDFSIDKTLQSLKKLESNSRRVEIFQHALSNNFSSQRTYGLKKATNNWILWLDPDEAPSRELITFIKKFNHPQYENYAFKREDIFIGHKLNWGETGNVHFTRLFNKNFGKFEHPVHEIWSSNKDIHTFDLVIDHSSHKTLSSFFTKINLYSTIRANELKEQGTKSGLFSIIIYPTAKFIQNYFFRFGFLDSTAGIIFALGMSFHSFLVRAKLWHLSQQ